jgi:RNA polymerase sigma factor (sigma-70 family)
MDDNLLWSKLKKGDHPALKEIYDANVRQLINYAKKITTDIELIEDTIHDIFVQIWQRKENLGDTDSIIKYLCVTLRRELIRRLEKNSKTTGFDRAENSEINFTVSAEDLIIQSETSSANKARLLKAFESLSHRQREAIYLKYYEELSYEQICEIMDINYQSVRNLISKGINDLRKIIGIFFIAIVSWMF